MASLARVLRTLRASGDMLEGASKIGVVICLGVMIGITAAQVFLRYLVGQPIFWAEELARYLLVWAALLSTGLAVRRSEHCRIDLLLNAIPPRLRCFIIFFGLLLVAVFALVIVVYGAMLNRTIYVTDQRSPALGISMVLPYSAIPVGFALICFHAVEQALTLICSSGKPSEVREA